MKFRKKTVVIEAIIWNNNFDEIYKFMDADNNYGIVGIKNGNSDILQIRTLEGVMDANIGDYIIRDVKGEYYPCKPDIFEMTYELASTSSQTLKDYHIVDTNEMVSSQTEISDEEIQNFASDFYDNNGADEFIIIGAKWYREQLKQL